MTEPTTLLGVPVVMVDKGEPKQETWTMGDWSAESLERAINGEHQPRETEKP